MRTWLVDPDISIASTLHKDYYLQAAAYEASKERIFANTWQWLTCTALSGQPRRCHPTTLLPGMLNEPLVITTSDDGTMHCLSNVCTHRGALVVKETCTQAHLRCPYHGRMFSLDGRFRSMPEFLEVKDFPKETDNLASLPVMPFAGSLFTRLAGSLPFEAFFGEIMRRLNWLPFETFTYRPNLSKDYHVKAHWALYCENYLEGFHIPFVHPALNQALDFGSYTTELYEYSSLQLGIAKDGEDCFDLPLGSPDFGKKVAAYYYFVFPNLMFNFYPWGLSLNVVQPQGPELTKVSFHAFVGDAARLRQGAGGDVDATELEDEEVVEKVQAGIRSRFYQQGRYSVRHEKGTHHFHRLIAAFMNA